MTRERTDAMVFWKEAVDLYWQALNAKPYDAEACRVAERYYQRARQTLKQEVEKA